MAEINVLFVPWHKLTSAQLQSYDVANPPDGFEYLSKNQQW